MTGTENEKTISKLCRAIGLRYLLVDRSLASPVGEPLPLSYTGRSPGSLTVWGRKGGRRGEIRLRREELRKEGSVGGVVKGWKGETMTPSTGR